MGRTNWKRLDFILGSVHYLNRADQMFDSVPEGAQQFSGRDIDDVYCDYFGGSAKWRRAGWSIAWRTSI